MEAKQLVHKYDDGEYKIEIAFPKDMAMEGKDAMFAAFKFAINKIDVAKKLILDEATGYKAPAKP